MFPLDAIVATIVLLVPGFIALKIILTFPIVKERTEYPVTDFLLWSAALSIGIQFLYYLIVVKWINKPTIFATFATKNIANHIFDKEYLLGLLLLLVISILFGLIVGFVVQLIVAKVREKTGKAKITRPLSVIDHVFDRKISPYVIVFYDTYAYQGWLSNVGSSKEDTRIYLKEVLWMPVQQGTIVDYENKQELDIEGITLDIAKANHVWVLK